MASRNSQFFLRGKIIYYIRKVRNGIGKKIACNEFMNASDDFNQVISLPEISVSNFNGLGLSALSLFYSPQIAQET